MGIGSYQSQRRDSCSRLFAIGPLRIFRDHLCRHPLPRDVLRRFVEMNLLRNHSVMECQNSFDQSGGTAGRFEVANVCFHRSDQQWVFFAAAFGVNFHRGTDLHRIPELGSRAVGFQVLNLRRRNPRVLDRRTDHPRLGFAAGRSDASTKTVVYDRPTADHRHDSIAVALCVTQTF